MTRPKSSLGILMERQRKAHDRLMARRAKPLSKEKKKVAGELIGQIDHLTARWHLGFSEVERNLIRKALSTLTSTKSGD